ncbi:FliM/FliN family flagellar motor switch protein [Pseudomonas chlororaphis subsp. aurantiaca]|uniref:FliM/FliN family flagellar motor switch protein n=1 Tax=Pseudomonas chlororaphis TaxID=587753 RepID=UPI0027DB190D|nr:FliM/FliN family flagellar motor switch protein [Pseudomonas chlororaphis]WMI97558.1 FliM/FliN family flagellar motor switch protein [Pseudomonas chlororaphis subsp. aurantiaca]
MTVALTLRHLAASEYERRYAVARWRQDGHSVELRQPHSPASYISFWAQGAHGLWQGMVEASQWLHGVWPQDSQLRPDAEHAQGIFALFCAVECPVELASQLLDYTHLFDLELIQGDALPRLGLPCITTAQGDLWLLNLPTRPSDPSGSLQPWLLVLPQRLRVVLGYSALDRATYQRLAAGDVLFIAEQTRELFLVDRCIGQFTFIEEGLRMQLSPQDTELPDIELADAEPPATELLDKEPPPAEAAAPAITVSQLPVKLEFVLDERVLTIAELNELIEHQVLPLNLEAASRVEIRASGQCIATGELVQLDDRLGVELRDIYRGNGDE